MKTNSDPRCAQPTDCKVGKYGKVCRSCNWRSIQRRNMQDPEIRAKLVARLNSPEAKAGRLAAQRRITDELFAWCPEPLRDEYRFLKRKNRLLAAECRRIIEAEMVRKGLAP